MAAEGRQDGAWQPGHQGPKRLCPWWPRFGRRVCWGSRKSRCKAASERLVSPPSGAGACSHVFFPCTLPARVFLHIHLPCRFSSQIAARMDCQRRDFRTDIMWLACALIRVLAAHCMQYSRCGLRRDCDKGRISNHCDRNVEKLPQERHRLRFRRLCSLLPCMSLCH